MSTRVLDELRSTLRERLESRGPDKVTQNALAKIAGVQQASLSRFLKGEAGLNASSFLALLHFLGGGVVLGRELVETARDVCFVDARVVPAGSGQSPPQAEDYMAVPLVEEVGAGPGLIPQGELLSWFLVYKHQDAVRYRRDLIAVQIGRQSTSMMPTLHPGDVVLVDREDRDTHNPGRMMLVMDPDGAGKIKRVSVEPAEADYRIVYYSDNAMANPPEIYSLKKDFFGNWDRVIVGRVVWAWSDVSHK